MIPARGGSKGVRRKNIRMVAGRPLIAYTIEAAQRSRASTRLLCSTDDEEIAAVARSLECPVLMRPPALAGDATPMKEVIHHALTSLNEAEQYRPEVVVLLQPTSPLRRAEHIDESVKMLSNSKADAVVSVTAVPGHYHPDWQFTLDETIALGLYNGRPLSQIVTRRQDLTPTYTRNGAIYAFKVSRFYQSGSFYGETCLGYVMSSEDSVNIDSEEDLRVAEWRLKARAVG